MNDSESSSPNWLLPARSIPVFVGAHLVDAVTGNGCGVCVWIDDGHLGASDFRLGALPIVVEQFAPDLSNPDTFAAARDRLAVAMGCPPEDVASGVSVFRGMDAFTFARETCRPAPAINTPGAWILATGLRETYDADSSITMQPGWSEELRGVPIETDTRELALALAWQRVVGS